MNISAACRLEEIMLSRNSKTLRAKTLDCTYSRLLFGIMHIDVGWTHLKLLSVSFFSFLEVWIRPYTWNNAPVCLPLCPLCSSLFSSINSPELLEEDRCLHSRLTSPEVESPQHLSLSGFCINTRGRGGSRGRHMATTSTKHVISINRDGPWGCLLLWCDPLVSAQPWKALCAKAQSGGERLWIATKRRLL